MDNTRQQNTHPEMKQKYLSPVLKVVDFKVERGYEGSVNSFQRQSTDATLFEMLFDDTPRADHFTVDNWSSNASPASDPTQFTHDDWGNI